MNSMSVAADLEIAEPKPVYWAPVRTGDYVKDCQAGKTAAEEMVALMRSEESPMPFLAAFREACRRGEIGGFEIGFATAVALATM